jgi:hypothetical protein
MKGVPAQAKAGMTKSIKTKTEHGEWAFFIDRSDLCAMIIDLYCAFFGVGIAVRYDWLV